MHSFTLLLLAFLTAPFTVLASDVPKLPYSLTDVQDLRKYLLEECDLDSEVPPQQPEGIPTQVGMQLRVFKIISIDAITGLMRLMVWKRVSWSDPRLAWNETRFGGVTDVRLHPGRGKEGRRPDDNVWQPSLYFYNAMEDPDDTLENGATWVYSDGSVFQSRPGIIEVNCRFTGLVNFPYDELTCPFDVGGWDYGDNVQNLTFFDAGGMTLETSMETAGTSYQEYRITGYSTERQTFKYLCCPEPYSNLVFRISFSRPHLYYFWAIEFPGFMLTLVSFAVFWLDAANCGERLGLGVTLLLAVEVTKIVTNELLPVCGEMLWIELLLLVNEFFCVVAVLESCLAIKVAFDGLEKINEAKAELIDSWAKRVVPASYFVSLAIVYSITMDDGYESTTNPMFQGLASGKGAKIKVNILRALLVPILIAAVVGAFAASKNAKAKQLLLMRGGWCTGTSTDIAPSFTATNAARGRNVNVNVNVNMNEHAQKQAWAEADAKAEALELEGSFRPTTTATTAATAAEAAALPVHSCG